ncbi:MAG: MBL fold metallo-hydrolase [Thermoplasmatota archaeon]
MGLVTRRETHGPFERLLVSRTVAGRPLYFDSVYACDGVLIDTMMPRGAAPFAAFAEEQRVTTALITHAHEDHAGNARALLQRGVRVLVPPGEQEDVERGTGNIPFYRDQTWGSAEGAPGVEPLPAEVKRPGGGAFRVLSTPGHSRDHVAFEDTDTGWIFCGDAYIGKLKGTRPHEDVPAQVASLRRMRERAPPKLMPAHGRVVEDPRATLDATIEYFDSLERRGRALAAQGKSLREIRVELFGPHKTLFYVTRGDFSSEHLLRSLLSERS